MLSRILSGQLYVQNQLSSSVLVRAQLLYGAVLQRSGSDLCLRQLAHIQCLIYCVLACVRGGASVLLARAAGGCFVIFMAHVSLPVELTLCCLVQHCHCQQLPVEFSVSRQLAKADRPTQKCCTKCQGQVLHTNIPAGVSFLTTKMPHLEINSAFQSVHVWLS